MAERITVDSKGLVKVGGIPVCEKQQQDGETVLYFRRKNNCRQRGSRGDGEAVSLRDFVRAVLDGE